MSDVGWLSKKPLANRRDDGRGVNVADGVPEGREVERENLGIWGIGNFGIWAVVLRGKEQRLARAGLERLLFNGAVERGGNRVAVEVERATRVDGVLDF